MFCPSCGTRNPDTANFCLKCGTQLPVSANRGIAAVSPAESGMVTVAPQQRYAGFWIRFFAALVDAVIVGILQLIAGWLGAAITSPLWLVLTALGVAYYVSFTAWRGQTIGKMLLEIKVLDERGNIPGIGKAFIREVIGKFISGIVLLIGYIWAAFDSRKQAWHDKIAGTYVVRI